MFSQSDAVDSSGFCSGKKTLGRVRVLVSKCTDESTDFIRKEFQFKELLAMKFTRRIL